MSLSDELVPLQNGLIVPKRAYDLAIRLESEGVKLAEDSGRIAVPEGASDEQLAAIRETKHHLLQLLRYRPSDQHLRDVREAFPAHGAIVGGVGRQDGMRRAS